MSFKVRAHGALVTLLAALLVVGLTIPSGAAEDQVELTFITLASDRDAIHERWAAEYEAENPHVKVTWYPLPGGGYGEALLTRMAGGAPIDVMWMGAEFAPLREHFLDLGEIVRTDPAGADIHPVPLASHEWRGEQLAIPFGINAHAFFYNADRFAEVGLASPDRDWTWDDAVSMGRQLSRDLNGDGETDQWGMDLSFGSPYILSYGGDMYAPDGKSVQINRPATIEAVQLYGDIFSGKLGVQPPPGHSLGNSLQQVLSGVTAMANRGPFDLAAFRRNAPFDWDVAMMPALAVGDTTYRATFHSSESWAVSKYTNAPQEARDFVRWLIQPERMRELAQLGAGAIPAQTSIATETFFALSPPESMDVFAETLNHMPAIFFDHPKWIELTPVLFGETWQAIMQGEIPASSGIPEIERQVNAILAQED